MDSDFLRHASSHNAVVHGQSYEDYLSSLRGGRMPEPRRVDLHRMQFGACLDVDPECLSSIKLEKFVTDEITGRLRFEMRAWITAQHQKTYEFSKPASAWDHVKVEILPRLPAWLRRRFSAPAFVTERVEKGVLYPDLIIPEQRHVAYVLKR